MPKKKQEGMPTHNYSEEEFGWYAYCVRNNIRISPGAVQGDIDHWHIDVCLDGKKWHRSPEKYDRETIWNKYYQICRYYHDKAKNN